MIFRAETDSWNPSSFSIFNVLLITLSLERKHDVSSYGMQIKRTINNNKEQTQGKKKKKKKAGCGKMGENKNDDDSRKHSP